MDIIQQYDTWHEAEEHQQIIDHMQAEEQTDPDALWRVARTFNALAQYEDALDLLSPFLEDPDTVPDETALGNILMQAGYAYYETECAVEAFEAFSDATMYLPSDEADSMIAVAYSLMEEQDEDADLGAESGHGE